MTTHIQRPTVTARIDTPTAGLTDPAAHARQRITSDMRHALTLPLHDLSRYMARYDTIIGSLAARCAEPDAAYTALSNYADDLYEQLVEEAESQRLETAPF